MDSAELLAQLADIHMPAEVSFWPPAPGWWVLALLILAALAWFTMYLQQQVRQRRICAFALQELDTIYNDYNQGERQSNADVNEANLAFINQCNAVIRRVALWHYPDSGIASIGGAAWVDFIREKGESSGMTDEIAEALSQGRFQTHCDVDISQLYQFGQQWISSLYMNTTNAENSSRLIT